VGTLDLCTARTCQQLLLLFSGHDGTGNDAETPPIASGGEVGQKSHAAARAELLQVFRFVHDLRVTPVTNALFVARSTTFDLYFADRSPLQGKRNFLEYNFGH
jgi:hypothetical protein